MEYTTSQAAQYLAERGFTVGRRWSGGHGPVSARTVRAWCERGKFPGAVKSGDGNRATWKIPQNDLNLLLEKSKSEVKNETDFQR